MSPFDDPEFENYLGQVVEKYCVEQHFRIYKFQQTPPHAALSADVDSATCRSNYALESDAAQQFYDETLQHHTDQCTERCQKNNEDNCAGKCEFSKLPVKKRKLARPM